MQREFYRERENHDAVDFQRSNEQYAAWKASDTEEEEVEPIVVPPTTWAEALRRKTNLARGVLESPQALQGKQLQSLDWQVGDCCFTGPVKPKLVARAPGSDQSPWKIKKDAPKISARDVPGALRPLMSCALWRLHEHIDRNDTNELFLFTDQAEIRNVAEKLNINVRSTPDCKHTLAGKTGKSNLAVLGDLEREFGIQQKALRSPDLNGLPDGSQRTEISQPLFDGVTNMGDDAKEPIIIQANDRSDQSQDLQGIGRLKEEGQKEETIQNSPRDRLVSSVNGNEGKDPLLEKPSAESVITLVEAAAPTKIAWSAVVKGSSNGTKAIAEFGKNVNGLASNTSHGTVQQDGLKQESQEILKATPTPPSMITSPPEVELVTPVQPSKEDHVQTPTTPAHLNAAIDTSLKQGHDVDESEDSDEEVVVFKPSAKRYSTQKQPVQQNSRPSTPVPPSQQRPLPAIVQLQQKPVDASSKPVTLKPEPQPRPGSSHGRHPLAVSHGHPQSKNSPMVIDPDAFGRSFAVNTNPSPRNLHNARSHHNPRAPMHNGQHMPSSQSPRREHARTSSAHRTPRDDVQLLTPALETRSEISPRTSPKRRSRAFEVETDPPKAFDPTPGAGRRPTTPASKKAEIDDFVPRSGFSETQLMAHANQPRPSEVPESVPRSQMTEVQVETITSTPKVFEPIDDFVPRSTMSQPLYKPRASEPEYIEPRASMPDVQYFLKSGSTRASARGRGRLWTPS